MNYGFGKQYGYGKYGRRYGYGYAAKQGYSGHYGYGYGRTNKPKSGEEERK